MKDFDPTLVKKVKITEVRENSWNPKISDTLEYQKVVESIQVNGFKQPIIVRENDNGDSKYEILDGAQRYRAARELGLSKIYIYNMGEVPDAEAKSVTIWTQVQVGFEDLALAPLLIELNEAGMSMPYSEEEVEDYQNLLKFEFTDDGKMVLVVKCTPAQLETIKKILSDYKKSFEVIEESQALVELVKLGTKKYE